MGRIARIFLALLFLCEITLSSVGCSEYLIEKYRQYTGQEEPEPEPDPGPGGSGGGF